MPPPVDAQTGQLPQVPPAPYQQAPGVQAPPQQPVYTPVPGPVYAGQEAPPPPAGQAYLPQDAYGQAAGQAYQPGVPTGELAPQEAAPKKKKKKTGLVLLILLIVVVLIAGGGGAAWYFLVKKKASSPTTTAPAASTTPSRPASPRPTGSPAAGQSYTSPLGFTVVIPPGWSQKLEGNLETLSNNAQDEKFAVVQIVDHGDKSIDPSAFVSQLVNKLQNDQGYKLEQQPQNVTYNGLPAVRARVSTVQNGYQVVVEIFAVKSPSGRLYQIQNVGSAEYFASQLQLYKQIEQSFTFN